MRSRTLILSAAIIVAAALLSVNAYSQEWPDAGPQARPYTRWWWLGNAVDKDNLSRCLEEYSKAGIGGVEITPLYGVQGNEANDIEFLSPKWMEMLRHTIEEGDRLGLQVDMNTGTGWPFGGPQITPEYAATSHFFVKYDMEGGKGLEQVLKAEDTRNCKNPRLDRLMAYRDGKVLDLTSKVTDGKLDWKAPEGGPWQLVALFIGNTFHPVKRAAPGGEGYELDHLNPEAVKHYLDRFDKAFEESGAPFPDTFFNDSYEVYDAGWTPGLLEEFRKRRGYRLEDHFLEFMDDSKSRSETSSRVISDYRETLSDMLKENFTKQWCDWAHSHGCRTRNQAHGSPGNLIDLYGLVDIPECEGFGLSDFHIEGLRKDSLVRKNDCDLSMLKYASSGAHVSGKPFTSSETFTWLTEHFRTSLSQCKPDLDLMFVSGVNHVYFHGTTYSPEGEPWPGWKFYASIDMSPTNPQWDCMPWFDSYIRRCQSFLQAGAPDNDFLLYLPIYNIWNDVEGTYLAFEIDKMTERAPEFIDVVTQIDRCGYDVDYISDDFIRSTKVEDGLLVTSGGTRYKALVLPAVRYIPEDVLKHVIRLAKKGATVVFKDGYPASVPGLGNLARRQKKLERGLRGLPEAIFTSTEVHPFRKGRIVTGSDFAQVLEECGGKMEEIKSVYGAHCIRRALDNGFSYFISSLQDKGVDGWVTLGSGGESAVIYDPMSGKAGEAEVRTEEGKFQVRIQIASGESVIVRTFNTKESSTDVWEYVNGTLPEEIVLDKGWTLSFPWSEPAVDRTFALAKTGSWTEIGDATLRINSGKGLYVNSFQIKDKDSADDWILDLGDVRESATVKVNGKEIGCLWAVPYRVSIGDCLKEGLNTLEVEVTNLPANRISEYDRQGVKWRRFKDINVVNIHYTLSNYSDWDPVPSGLCSPVRIIPVKN